MKPVASFFARFENRTQPKVNFQCSLRVGGGGRANLLCHPELSSGLYLASRSQMFAENISVHATSDNECVPTQTAL